MDKLAAMRVFVAIVDGGTLTEAARRLGKSLPSVVRSLARLEEALGLRLLERSTRQSYLTPEGRSYYETCCHVLSEIDTAEQDLAAQQGEPAGEVRITAPVEFGNRFVWPCLRDIRERFPGLVPHVTLTDVPLDLVEGGYDLAVRIGPQPDSEMRATVIGEMPTRHCAAPSFLERVGRPERPEDMAAMPAVCVDIAGRRTGQLWPYLDADGKRRTFRCKAVLYVNEVRMARAACEAGVGLGFFYLYQVHDAIADGRLVSLFQDRRPPPQPVRLIRHAARDRPKRVSAAIDALEGVLREALKGLGA